MALMEVNFFSKALMRPVTMNVILPADKVFFEEETEEDVDVSEYETIDYEKLAQRAKKNE